MITQTSTLSGLVRRPALAAAAVLVALVLAFGATPAPAHAATKAWGGYSDGKIPLTKLSKVPNGWLRPDAAVEYTAFSKAFSAKFKKPLSLTEGYRTYATQKALFIARNSSHTTPQHNDTEWAGLYWTRRPNTSLAAIPGTSVHGWALAADFGANVNKAGSAEKKWADANGPKFGWYPIGNTFGEPWHYEFTPLTASTKK